MNSDQTDSDEFDIKQNRLEHPSGWMEVTRYETVRFIVDALLESSPGHEFNKSELSRRTGVSREAIREHLPYLANLGVIDEVDGSGWEEYRLNDDSRVSKALFNLNNAINAVNSGQHPEDTTKKIEIPIPELGFQESPTFSGAIIQPYSVDSYSEKSTVAQEEKIGFDSGSVDIEVKGT